MKYAQDFLFEMPKSDLHLHLDGSLRIESMLEMAKTAGVELPGNTPQELKEKVFKDKYENLGEYLQGFQYSCAILREPENMERAAYELAWDNINENVCYIEVRFAPQLLMDLDRSNWHGGSPPESK